MRYIKGIDRNQLMMPESLEDLLKDPGPVHIIDAFVDGLDMKELGFERSEAAETGRPGYAPGDLLKLYLYGYLNGIRSSRKLMRECRRNVEVYYLLGRLEPDFRTIADFRKENAAGIREVFVEFSRLCSSLDLYGEEAAIDGGKFRACNGRKKMYNENILNKKLSRIQEKIEEHLQEMEKADREGGTVYGRRSACRQCTNRCTPSRNLKTVKFGPSTQYVAARMYGQKEPVISPPPGFTPNNSFFKKERIQRKVVIQVPDDPERQKERLCITEKFL